jgi:ribonucleotide monophosphatase NagD (HAD superfamily)
MTQHFFSKRTMGFFRFVIYSFFFSHPNFFFFFLFPPLHSIGYSSIFCCHRGVMHDGIQPYPGVVDVIHQLKQAGKELVILSNSSKRRDNSVKMLQKLGFNPNDFSQIITSGEVAYQLLLSAKENDDGRRSDTASSSSSPSSPSSSTSTTSLLDSSSLLPQPWPILKDRLLLNKSVDDDQQQQQQQYKVFCLGSGDEDEDYLTSCGWTLSSTVPEASLIVARGTFTIWNNDGTVTHKTRDGEELYAQRLATVLDMAAQYQIPMIVANPDKIRPDADRSPMPGTIGDAYERALKRQFGGEKEDNTDEEATTKAEQLVKRIGKPFPDVYEIALRQQQAANGDDNSISSLPMSRVCMVGDALETDVTGGTLQGIDTLWVIQDGIHNVAVEEYRQRILTTTTGDIDTDSSLAAACAAVLNEFNQQCRDESTTYAKGRQIRPSMVMRHFCW